MKNFMKINIAIATILTLFLVGCGSDSGTNSGTTEASEAKTIHGLGECKEANEGVTKRVISERAYYKCEGGDWKRMEPPANSSSSKVSSSSVYEIKSSSSSFTLGVEFVRDTMIDPRDGRVYSTVTIVDQEWMAENLNYRYLGPTYNLDSSSFCYDDDPANCETFGRLYTWSAAMDSAGIIEGNMANDCGEHVDYYNCPYHTVRGVCPSGWHLPSGQEWKTLIEHVSLYAEGNIKVGYNYLKSQTGWIYNDNGMDVFGFSVLPAGFWYGGDYCHKGISAIFWSSSQYSAVHASTMEGLSLESQEMKDGCSVRCIRDMVATR